ncbi:hypothetical protein EV174_000089 [Coemansia sp. RSA 2320]|nr:hypothetical protein EV174_000089 [Coemansia sp. RSA 2320]
MKHIKDIYELSGLNLPHGWIKEELVNPENAGLLAQYGHSEMEGIALRMMQRYSTFLTERLLHPETLRFVSSEFQRSYMSARTFRDVVDPGNLTQPVTVVPLSDDVSLAMKFNCPLWLQDKPAAAHNSSLEVEVFDSIHGQRLRQSIGDRLDIDSSVLKVEGIAMLYSLCGYDLSLFAETNSWCTLFDPDTAALLELRNDIKYSRIYGPYGATTNKKMACSLLTEVFAEMDQALQNQSSAVSTFRFGHAETIMFVSTLLGLEQALGSYNSPIAGAMSPVVALRRGFKTTAIAPFASNLGIELYKDQTMFSSFTTRNFRQIFKRPAVANDSEFSTTPTLRPLNKDMLKLPEVRRILIRFCVFVFLAFTPLIFAAVALSFSSPTGAGRTAIYLVTITVAFVAIGYGGWKSYTHILHATEPSSSGPHAAYLHQQHSRPVATRVNSAVDAFSSEQRYYTNEGQAESSQTLAGHNDGSDGRVLSLTPYNPPMPEPPAGYGAPQMAMPAAPQVHPLMNMPYPRIPEPAYQGSSQPQHHNVPVFVPLNGGNDDTHARAPPPAQNRRFTIEDPMSPQRNAMSRRSSAGVTTTEGPHRSEDAESPYDDDDSAQLYSFDKVKVTQDDSVRPSRRSSHRHSAGSVPNSEWNAQSQYSSDLYQATPSTMAAFNPRSDNPQMRSVVMQAQRPMLVSADQLSVSHGSSSDLSVHLATGPSASNAAPDSTHIAPPKRDLPPRPDVPSQADEGYVEKWLESSTQPNYHPAMRRIGQGMSSPSLATSSIDLMIPEKFAAPDAGKIVKTAPMPPTQNLGRSIYGEQAMLESGSKSNATIDHLVGDMLASAFSTNGHGLGAAPMPAPRPKLQQAGTFGSDTTNIDGISNNKGKTAVKMNGDAELHRDDMTGASSASEQTPVPTAKELADLDRPLLESSDLSLKRATLADYQNTIKTKNEMSGDWKQQTSAQFAGQQWAQSAANTSAQTQDQSGSDSRYFSAVSLPQPPHQAAKAMDTFQENDEDDFLDEDDSDDGFVSKMHSPMDLKAPEAPADDTKWRTNSINFSNMAAELARALTQPNGPHESLLSLPPRPSCDSGSIEVFTPEISPMHVQQVTSSHAQRAVVHGRQPNSEHALPGNARSRFSMSPVDEEEYTAIKQK